MSFDIFKIEGLLHEKNLCSLSFKTYSTKWLIQQFHSLHTYLQSWFSTQTRGYFEFKVWSILIKIHRIWLICVVWTFGILNIATKDKINEE